MTLKNQPQDWNTMRHQGLEFKQQNNNKNRVMHFRLNAKIKLKNNKEAKNQ